MERYTWMALFLLFVQLCSASENVADQSSDPSKPLHIETLNEKSFTEFLKRPGIQMVYFFKPTSGDNHRQAAFLKQYAISAKILSAYQVHVGLVECPNEHVPVYCDRHHVEDNVYSFRDGHELLSLSLPNMFDIDSIVANVLQIALLREVPIIQSIEERQEYVEKHKGMRDVIFSFQVAIGTKAHRILMESAYAYGSQYAFAITTEKPTVQDLPGYNAEGDSMMWLLRCKSAGENEPCQTFPYMGNKELGDVARFLRVIDIPLVHDVVKDGAFNPFDENDLHCVYMFYDDLSKAQAEEHTKQLLNTWQGIFGVMHINVNLVDPQQYGLRYGSKIPTVGVLLRGEKSLVLMDLEQPDPYGFVHNELCRDIKHLKPVMLGPRSNRPAPDGMDLEATEFSQDELIGDDVSDVETEDDQVAAAVNKIQVAPDMTYIRKLTDKTFPKVTQESDLVMVLFYLKFDQLSMAAFLHFVDASYILSNESSPLPGVLAAVNCFDWTDVCGRENITSYPNIRVYRSGREMWQYRGMLSAKAFVSAIHMLQSAAPVPVSTVDEASTFLEGNLPEDTTTYTNTSVLGLFHTNSIESLAFQKAATTLQGKFVLGMAVGKVAQDIASVHSQKVPCVLIGKRDDPHEPITAQKLQFSADNIVRFVEEKSLPTLPELSAINLPAYLLMEKPLLLLFHEETTSPEHQALAQLIKALPHVVMASLHVSDMESLNMKILASYSPVGQDENGEPVLPTLVLVNRQAGTVHGYPGSNLDQPKAILQWVNDVLEEKHEPQKMLVQREWKPLNPGFDFLRMIKQEEMAKNNPDNIDHDRKRRIELANEQGMGFEEDGSPMLRHGEPVNPHDVLEKVEQSREPVDDADVRAQLLAMRHSHIQQRAAKPGHTAAPHTEL